MNNFDKVEAIRDLWYCHSKQDLAKMVVEQQEELANCRRMYANASATLGEIQGCLGIGIVGIEPELVKQVIDERDALAAHAASVTLLMNRLFRCDDYSANGEGEGTTDGLLVPAELVEEFAELSATTPATSLARRDKLKQAEVLENAAYALKNAPLRGECQRWHHVAANTLEYEAKNLRQQVKELSND